MDSTTETTVQEKQNSPEKVEQPTTYEVDWQEVSLDELKSGYLRQWDLTV